MAKKPVIKQLQGPKLTILIQKYASEIAELKETIHDPNIYNQIYHLQCL